MEPFVVTSVERDTTNVPILIIDRRGMVGAAIYEKIKGELTTALVSSLRPETVDNLIYIPYKNRIPEIPNGSYSMIIVIADNEKDLWEIARKSVIKAREDAVPFIFVVDYIQAEEKLLTKITESYEESYVVILGEFFGQGSSILDSYIIQAGATRTIKLPSMGLRKIHPVLFADAIAGILQIIFGIQKRNRITYLYQSHTYTDLSIAHMLQKIDPLLHIDFHKDKKSKERDAQDVSLHGHYFFDTTYNISEKIVAVYNDLSQLRKAEKQRTVYKEPEPILELDGGGLLTDGLKKGIGLFFYYVLIVLLIPLCSLGISLWISSLSFSAAQANLTKGNTDQLRGNIYLAQGSFSFDDIIKTPLVFELQIVGLHSIAQQVNDLINDGNLVTTAVGNIVSAQDLLGNITKGTSLVPPSDVAAVISLMRSSVISLQHISTSNTSPTYVEQIGKYQKGISIISGTLGLLPDVLSINGKHIYLVLVQNNNELRPGGGMIRAYGIVSFEHGKMGKITFYPVSQVDNMLKEHIDPPFALRRYMDILHAYVRDSSFDPDFVYDAQQASLVFSAATGQKLDGVMSMDLNAIASLLQVTGPIAISSRAMTITDSNFLQQTAAQADSSNFLAEVMNALQSKLQTQRNINEQMLLTNLTQSIEEKHLLFAIANLGDQQILTVNHLSSSLWDSRVDDNGTINDYLGISEGNLGSNQVNYSLKRSIKQAVSIDGDGTLTGQVQLTYTNTDKKEDYKNYIQLLVPKDTLLKGISINGQPEATHSAITDPEIYEAKGFVPPPAIEVNQTTEEGKVIYGFLVTIPASTTKLIQVSYQHAQKINLGSPVLHYSLYLYKQPGTNNDPLSFAFNYPLEYSILSANPANQDGESDYTVDTKLSEDKIIDVTLTKK